MVCRQPGPDLDIDHIQAKGMGGSAERDVPENKVPLCRGHHNAKHQRALETQVSDGLFQWRGRGADFWVDVPVRVNKRHGCLDFATEGSAAGEQSNREEAPSVVASGISAPPAAGSGREAESAAAEACGSSMAEPWVGKPQGASRPGDAGSNPARKGSAAAPSASAKSSAGEGDLPLAAPVSGRAGALPSAAVPSLALPGTITPTSLTLPRNLSIEGWAQVGETLGNIHRASRFWIGDWLVFGEDTYHEKVAQSMDATGLEFETLANIASVCRRVPASRRRESLSFGHHTEVAAQEPDRQVALLAEAEKQGWSVRATREAVSGKSEPRPEPMGLCPECAKRAPLSLFKEL